MSRDTNNGALQLIAAQPELFEPDFWTDSEGVLLNGPASNCSERVADAYASLCSSAWQADLARWPMFATVGRYALAHGYLLHPDAAAALLAD